MAFHVDIREADLAYLHGLAGVSDAAKDEALARCLDELGNAEQSFRDIRRLAPGSPYFEHGLFVNDGGTIHHFRFVVDDSAANYGVLRVVYVEHTPGRRLP